MAKVWAIAVILSLVPGAALAASAPLPIRAGVIGHADVVRACETDSPESIGWVYLDTFAISCQRIADRGELGQNIYYGASQTQTGFQGTGTSQPRAAPLQGTLWDNPL